MDLSEETKGSAQDKLTSDSKNDTTNEIRASVNEATVSKKKEKVPHIIAGNERFTKKDTSTDIKQGSDTCNSYHKLYLKFIT